MYEITKKEREHFMKKLKLFRKIKSILSILLISLLIIPLCSGIGIHAKEKNTESNEYKIYPIPHSVVYDNEQFVMSDRVHVVFEEGIDKATQNFLEEVITDYGKTVVHSEEIVNGETTILLGIKGSNGKADSYTIKIQRLKRLIFSIELIHIYLAPKKILSQS